MTRTTPEDVLKIAQAMSGDEGRVLRLCYGLASVPLDPVEVGRMLHMRGGTVEKLLHLAERRLHLAVFDEALSEQDVRAYLVAGVDRRRAGILPEPEPGPQGP